jgi:hypothetical protein
MCFFCAAIPMTVGFGARAHVRHIERRDKAVARGERPPKFVNMRVIQRASAVAAVGLMAGAVIYHTTIAPQIGA